MKRGFSIATGAVAMLALAGCSVPSELARSVGRGVTSAEGVSTDDAVEAGPPAFHFESGTLELGDFDPYEIGEALFNPCEEISAAEFAAIGFQKDGTTLQFDGNKSCSLSKNHSSGHLFAISGGTASLEVIRRSPRQFAVDVSDVVPGVYTYGADRSNMNTCYASVDTVRGQVGTLVSEGREPLPFDELCVEAVSIVEALYSL